MTIWTNSHHLGKVATAFGSDRLGPEPAGDLGLFRKGCRVLVLENDPMLADDLRRELDRKGVEVVGPAATVAEALDLLLTGLDPDFAILDVFLDDEVAYPVADTLRGLGVPFIFAIHGLDWAIPHAYADVPRTEKPVTMRRLAQALMERATVVEGQPL